MDKNKFRFGFNAFWWEKLWDEKNISQVVDCLRRLGYQAVEYKETSFNPNAKLENEFKRAVRVTKESGLEVSNFVILRDAADPDSREKTITDVTNCIRACVFAGVDKLNLITGGMPPEVSSDKDKWWLPKEPALTKSWDSVFACFEEFLKVAEECKVYLVVEACVGQMAHDYYSTLELMKRFDSEYLALTFDPSHYLLYRNDIPWAIRQWNNKIKHVHLKDAVGHSGQFGIDFLFPILGEGAINWTQFFEALSDINYQGVISAEFESFKYMDEVIGNNPIKAAELTMQSIKSLTRLLY